MTEKNIDSEKREKDLRYFLVVLLLLVICCLEFIHIYKLNKITHKHHWMNRIENMVDKDFKHKKPMDIRSMQQNANKIREDLKNKMQQVQNAQTASAETKQQYDAEKGVFVIEMEIPSNLTAKNIAIELQDSILGVGFGEVENTATQQDVLAVNQFFAIPQTKATTTDIKYAIKDGTLMIAIPIIK